MKRAYTLFICVFLIWRLAEAQSPSPSPTFDPYASPTIDPYASSTPDPYASSTPDPYASSTPDPYASSTPDPYASSTPDPYGSPTPYPSYYYYPTPSPTSVPSNGGTSFTRGDGSSGIDSMFSWSDIVAFFPNYAGLQLSTGCSTVPGLYNAFWFDGYMANRFVETKDFETTGGTLSWWMVMGDSSMPSCEAPDDGEGILVSYSTDKGGSWTALGGFDAPTVYTPWNYNGITFEKTASGWHNYSFPINAAKTIRFKWYQISSSCGGCDNWAIDAIELPPLKVSNITVSPKALAGEMSIKIRNLEQSKDWPNQHSITTSCLLTPFSGSTIAVQAEHYYHPEGQDWEVSCFVPATYSPVGSYDLSLVFFTQVFGADGNLTAAWTNVTSVLSTVVYYKTEFYIEDNTVAVGSALTLNVRNFFQPEVSSAIACYATDTTTASIFRLPGSMERLHDGSSGFLRCNASSDTLIVSGTYTVNVTFDNGHSWFHLIGYDKINVRNPTIIGSTFLKYAPNMRIQIKGEDLFNPANNIPIRVMFTLSNDLVPKESDSCTLDECTQIVDCVMPNLGSNRGGGTTFSVAVSLDNKLSWLTSPSVYKWYSPTVTSTSASIKLNTIIRLVGTDLELDSPPECLYQDGITVLASFGHSQTGSYDTSTSPTSVICPAPIVPNDVHVGSNFRVHLQYLATETSNLDQIKSDVQELIIPGPTVESQQTILLVGDQAAVCGNGQCENSDSLASPETCESCPSDCGACSVACLDYGCCQPGSKGSLGGPTCEDCPIGYYAEGSGSTTCKAAPLNTYIATNRSTAGTTCGQGGITLVAGATDPMQCVPLAGYYRAVVYPAPVFYECVPKEACLGGNIQSTCLTEGIISDDCLLGCADGYTGLYCGDCADNHYRLSGYCAVCPNNQGVVAALFVVVFAGAVAVLKKISKLKEQLGTVTIGINGIQIATLFPSFSIPWPSTLVNFFSSLSFFNLNLELTNPECSSPIMKDYFYKWLIWMLIPFGALALLAVACFWAVIRNWIAWHFGAQLKRLSPKYFGPSYEEQEEEKAKRRGTIVRQPPPLPATTAEVQPAQPQAGSNNGKGAAVAVGATVVVAGGAAAAVAVSDESAFHSEAISDEAKDMENRLDKTGANVKISDEDKEHMQELADDTAQALGSASDHAAQALGDMSSAVGNAFGDEIGDAIGDALGGASGFFNQGEQPDEIEGLDDLKAQLAEAFGGLDALKEELGGLGDIGDLTSGVFNNSLNMDGMQEFFEEFEEQAEDMFEEAGEGLGDLGDATKDKTSMVLKYVQKYAGPIIGAILVIRDKINEKKMKEAGIDPAEAKETLHPNYERQALEAMGAIKRKPKVVEPTEEQKAASDVAKESDIVIMPRGENDEDIPMQDMDSLEAGEAKKEAEGEAKDEEAPKKGCSAAFRKLWGIIKNKVQEQCISMGHSLVVRKQKQDVQLEFYQYIGMFFLFLTLAYTFLATNALEPLDCTKQKDGTRTLDARSSIVCYQGRHSFWAGISILFTILYVIGIPVVLLSMLISIQKRKQEIIRERVQASLGEVSDKRKSMTLAELEKRDERHNLEMEQNDLMIGFMTIRYETERYWWDVTILVRKLAIIVVQKFFSTIPLFSISTGLAVLFVSLISHVIAQPFLSQLEDYLETLQTLTNFVTLFSGLMYLTEKFPDPESQSTLSWIIVAIQCSVFAGVILLTIMNIFKKTTNAHDFAQGATAMKRELFARAQQLYEPEIWWKVQLYLKYASQNEIMYFRQILDEMEAVVTYDKYNRVSGRVFNDRGQQRIYKCALLRDQENIMLIRRLHRKILETVPKRSDEDYHQLMKKQSESLGMTEGKQASGNMGVAMALVANDLMPWKKMLFSRAQKLWEPEFWPQIGRFLGNAQTTHLVKFDKFLGTLESVDAHNLPKFVFDAEMEAETEMPKVVSGSSGAMVDRYMNTRAKSAILRTVLDQKATTEVCEVMEDIALAALMPAKEALREKVQRSVTFESMIDQSTVVAPPSPSLPVLFTPVQEPTPQDPVLEEPTTTTAVEIISSASQEEDIQEQEQPDEPRVLIPGAIETQENESAIVEEEQEQEKTAEVELTQTEVEGNSQELVVVADLPSEQPQNESNN